jgi:Family of unknown function (DUF6314)
MFEVLFGCKTVQKILIFLFVNGKCYGTQLHNLLSAPLTPIQKALLRLEKGGVIMSDYEGKTRLYRFNPAFPLLSELEQLLKKAYTLLPPQEKRLYAFVKEERRMKQLKMQEVLLSVWERLGRVKELTFDARSKSKEKGGWSGKGKGEVMVSKEGDSVMIFQEKGAWHGEEIAEMDFNNVFRWTLDRRKMLISLEHLRFGPNRPVFLFDLAVSGKNTLSSVDSHLCKDDTYMGRIYCDLHCLRLNWRVIGPKKNEEIDYYYL